MVNIELTLGTHARVRVGKGTLIGESPLHGTKHFPSKPAPSNSRPVICNIWNSASSKLGLQAGYVTP